ncbi:MAG: alanine racemase [Coriobacteriia bacterium]|nr:alanine racemase [Coriobacteriia bacterium]
MIPRYAHAEIDLGAIAHNVRSLKALTRNGTLFMAVVKADAYGHGAVPVARAALAGGADRLAVATISEALELREAGVTATLHLLQEPPPSSTHLVLENDLLPMVTTREFGVALSRAAAQVGARALYHLKVDTGMNRIGVRAEDAAEFASRLGDLPGIELEGTCTHFATAEQPGDWDFERQVERFEEALEAIRTEGVSPGIVHAANSAATILHSKTHYDMVRCGIAMYGLQPGATTRDHVALRPAMQVKSRVCLVKRIQMGEGVSYGLTWRAAAPTTVATLPLGYADGVHRILSNKMSVLLGGRRCQQVGRVTMDQIMAEVPRGLSVTVGDEAVIVGTQGNESITMEELAEAAGTINYEMACAFGMRLERELIQ